MMKTLKVKLAIFSLLAITLVSGFFVSCEQEVISTPTIETAEGITQAEIDEAKAEFDLIMSYGEEVATAYEAYLNGEQLRYYAPLGVHQSVEFDWSNYQAIMEHSKISSIVDQNNMTDIYKDNLPIGTYLTREHVQELTPNLISIIDSSTESITDRGDCLRFIDEDILVNESDWSPYGRCHVTASCFGCGGYIITVWQKEWRKYCDTIYQCSALILAKLDGC